MLIGRGALRNPFLFEQAKALWEGTPAPATSPERYIELINTQRLLLLENFEERTALLHVRKFLAWYASGFPGASEFRRKVFGTPDPAVLWEEARLFFEKTAGSRTQKYLEEPFLMGGHGCCKNYPINSAFRGKKDMRLLTHRIKIGIHPAGQMPVEVDDEKIQWKISRFGSGLGLGRNEHGFCRYLLFSSGQPITRFYEVFER